MSELLLEATDLARHYSVARGLFKPKATVKALNGVSFKLAPKKTLAVVGESGCGKSTLARQLTLIEPLAVEISADTAVIGGTIRHAARFVRARPEVDPRHLDEHRGSVSD